MIIEEKEFHENGNLNWLVFKDENQKAQGLYKYYGGNKFVIQQSSRKNSEAHGICEHWNIYLNQTRIRKWTSTYKQDLLNGIEIDFYY